jgi:integrase
MLGTGLRISETLAMVWDAVDRVGGQVEVRGTVVRGKDGLKIQARPKTRSGWRKLHLPDWLVVVLDNREHVDTEWDVIFPSQLGKLLDRSNTASDLRDAPDPRLRVGDESHLPQDGGHPARRGWSQRPGDRRPAGPREREHDAKCGLRSSSGHQAGCPSARRHRHTAPVSNTHRRRQIRADGLGLARHAPNVGSRPGRR